MVLPRPGRAAALMLSALALMVAVFAASAARAQTDEVFTVRGVEVDVTAESAAAAREAALAEAQREGLDRLLQRLAPAEDLARLPPLSDAEINELVQDFQVESERTSAVRYIGDLTFRFRAEPVRRLLQRHGVRFVGIASKPVLVLPVLTTEDGSRLWDEPNPWRAAWAERSRTDGLVPLEVPLGDLSDLAAISATEALAGDAEGFAALAERYGTGETIVAEAEVAEPGDGTARLDLSARHYADGAVKETYTDSLTGSAEDRDALFVQAADRLDALVQEAWKQANLVSFGAEQALIATVPIAQLSDWVAVRRRLDDIAIVRTAEILYLTREEGRLRLAFVGDMTQLTRALAQQDLSLAPAADDSWILRLGAIPAEAAPAEPPATVVN